MRNILFLFISAALLAASPSFAEAPRYVEGEAIVMMRSGGASASARGARGLSLSPVSSAIDAETLGAEVVWNYAPVKSASSESAARSGTSLRGRSAGAASGDEYAVVHLRSASGESTERFVARLRENPNVVSAMPNYIMKLRQNAASGIAETAAAAAVATDDTYYDYQWGLRRINMLQVWAQTKDADTEEVVVAVIDTGIAYDHEDLKDKMYSFDGASLEAIAASIDGINASGFAGSHGVWFRTSFTIDGGGNPANTVVHDPIPIGPGGSTGSVSMSDVIGEPTANSRYVGDLYGHGTHVAGIIGAAANNGIGVAGTASNVKLMALNVFSAYEYEYSYSIGALLSDQIRAIDFVIAAKKSGVNVRVANMSLGSWESADNAEVNPYSQKLNELSAAGIIICTAAGNENVDIDNPPASYAGLINTPVMCRNENSNILSVGASSTDDKLGTEYAWSNYSSSGKWVDIFAPGEHIISTCKKNYVVSAYDETWSSTGYSYASGTSMASPFVAGAAAVLCSVFPEKSASEIKKLITDGANGSVLKEGYSAYGLLDVYASLEKGGFKITGGGASEPEAVSQMTAGAAPHVAVFIADAKSLPESFGSASGCVVEERAGCLYLDEITTNRALSCLGDSRPVAGVSPVPIFVTVSLEGEAKNSIGAVGLGGTGDMFGEGNSLSDIAVCKIMPDGRGIPYEYLDEGEARDGCYRIFEADGTAFDGTFREAKSYILMLYIEDGGPFDLDNKAGTMTDPVAVVRYSKVQPENAQPSVHSSGGGCSSGAGAAALFVLPLGALVSYFIKRMKMRQN